MDHLRILGSRISRRASPKILNPMTVIKMNSPGEVAYHHWSMRNLRPTLTMAPHSGVGGWVPSPIKLREAAMRIVSPRMRVARMMTEEKQFGRIWCRMIHRLLAPEALAAAINCFSLTARASPLTILANFGIITKATARIALFRLGPRDAATAI